MLELRLAQHLGGVANFPLAGQEHQHVAGAFALTAFKGGDFIKGGNDRLVDAQIFLDTVALFILLRGQRAIPGLDREGAARHLDNRCIVKVLGEVLQIDGGRSDDDFQVRPTRQQDFQVAQQEIDVQAAFVGFVDDDRVVAFQITVVLGFGQQDTVSHQLDQGVGIALILKPHLVTHQRAQRRGQFFGHPAGYAARRDSTGLGMADQTVLTATDLQTDFRQLGGFTRAGLTGQNQHLMLEQRSLDLIAFGCNRQILVITNQRHAGRPRFHLRARRLHPLGPCGQFGNVLRLFAQLMQLPAQLVAVGNHGLIKVFQQLVDSRRFVSHQVRKSLRKCRGRIVADLARTRERDLHPGCTVALCAGIEVMGQENRGRMVTLDMASMPKEPLLGGGQRPAGGLRLSRHRHRQFQSSQGHQRPDEPGLAGCHQ